MLDNQGISVHILWCWRLDKENDLQQFGLLSWTSSTCWTTPPVSGISMPCSNMPWHYLVLEPRVHAPPMTSVTQNTRAQFVHGAMACMEYIGCMHSGKSLQMCNAFCWARTWSTPAMAILQSYIDLQYTGTSTPYLYEGEESCGWVIAGVRT